MSKLGKFLRRFIGETQEAEGWVNDYPGNYYGRGTGAWQFQQLVNVVIDRLERQRGGNQFHTWEQDKLLFIARDLEKWNPFAQAILGALRGYTLSSKGMTVQVKSKEGQDGELAKLAMAYLDQFRDTEDWWDRERETYNRAHRDGDALIRFFVEDDAPRVGYIEPECLQPKDGTDLWINGIKHRPGNPERIEAYYCQFAPAEFEEVDAQEVYHIKTNVDRCIKKGISDFASTGEIISEAHKVWRNFTAAEAVRQSYTYLRQHAEGVTADEIDSFINEQASLLQSPTSLRTFVDNLPLQFRSGVGVEDITAGMTLAALPAAEALPGVVAGVNASLLAAGVRYQMPLWLISGDMSQNNVVDLQDESGFSVYIRGEQRWYAKHQRNIFWRVLQLGVELGQLPEAVLEAVDICVEPQSPPQRDPKAHTDRLKILHDDGIIGGRKRSEMEGFDYDAEQEEIKKEPPKHLRDELNKGELPQDDKPQPTPAPALNGSYLN